MYLPYDWHPFERLGGSESLLIFYVQQKKDKLPNFLCSWAHLFPFNQQWLHTPSHHCPVMEIFLFVSEQMFVFKSENSP
jgi:hypothetical protein